MSINFDNIEAMTTPKTITRNKLHSCWTDQYVNYIQTGVEKVKVTFEFEISADRLCNSILIKYIMLGLFECDMIYIYIS